MHVTLLNLIGGDLTLKQPLSVPGIEVDVVRVGDRRNGGSDQLAPTIAGEVAERVIDLYPTPIHVDQRQADWRVVEKFFQTPLRLAPLHSNALPQLRLKAIRCVAQCLL